MRKLGKKYIKYMWKPGGGTVTTVAIPASNSVRHSLKKLEGSNIRCFQKAEYHRLHQEIVERDFQMLMMGVVVLNWALKNILYDFTIMKISYEKIRSISSVGCGKNIHGVLD